MNAAAHEAIYSGVAEAHEEARNEYAEVTRGTLGYKFRSINSAVKNAGRNKTLLIKAITPDDGSPSNLRTCLEASELLHASILVMQAKFDDYDNHYNQFAMTCGDGSGDDTQIPPDLAKRHDAITKCFNEMLVTCQAERGKVQEPEGSATTLNSSFSSAQGSPGVTQPQKNQQFKPHEGLKPTEKLSDNPNAKEVKDFIRQFSAYFKSGNLDQADPEIQRAYLQANMSEILYERANAADPNPKAPIDPTNTNSGFFKYLLRACGELEQGRLTKFGAMFTTRHDTKGGELEPWLNMLSRMQRLGKECNFHKLDHDTIIALYCVVYCKDPKLTEEFYKVPPPFSLEAYFNVAMRHHSMLQQTKQNRELVAAAEGQSTNISVNATSTSGGKKCCKLCARPANPDKAFCTPCFSDIRRPASERSRISEYNCTKCNTKGNHVAAACTGKAYWPGWIDPKKGAKTTSRASRKPEKDDRSSRSRSKSGGSRSNSKSRGRRDPTPASKNWSANAVDNKVYQVPGYGPNPDTVNKRVTHVRIRFVNPADNEDFIADEDKTSHITQVLVYEYVRNKYCDRNRRLKAMARMKHYKQPAPQPWIPLLTPVLFIVQTALSLLTSCLRLPQTLASRVIQSYTRMTTLAIDFATTLTSGMTTPVTIPVNTVRVSINGMSRSYNPFDTLKSWPGCLNRNRLHQDLDDLRVMVGCSLHERNDCHTRHQLAVEACPDTGAAMSVVSKDIVDRLNAPIVRPPATVNLTAANDEPMATLGICQLRLFLEDQFFDVECLVTPAMTGRLLVGRPDLYKMRIISPHFPHLLSDSAWTTLQQD